MHKKKLKKKQNKKCSKTKNAKTNVKKNAQNKNALKKKLHKKGGEESVFQAGWDISPRQAKRRWEKACMRGEV